MGDALTGWLAALDAAAGSGWRRTDSAPSDTVADDLVLLRHGLVIHRLRLEADRVRWDTPALRWQASLAPADTRALRTRLDEATR